MFDRYAFESVVEKVIVGGYNEKGDKDPYMLTFIYKTGFTGSMDGKIYRSPCKNSKATEKRSSLCSHTGNKVEPTCSYYSDNPCRIYRAFAKGNLAEILRFQHFHQHVVFDEKGDKLRNKRKSPLCQTREGYVLFNQIHLFLRIAD